MFSLMIVISVILGTFAGAILSLIPALHIYNVAGIALLMYLSAGQFVPTDVIAPFFMSLVVAFSFINTIPMTFFSAADESASVTILPGTKMLYHGRGFEAAYLTGIGALIGICLLIILTPFFFKIMPYIWVILSPHLHWIILLIIVYMVMSEWPKGTGRGDTILKKFLNSWQNLFAGLATWILAGILGLIITTKSIISHEIGFQNIMPVFVGLFAIPSIIQNLVSDINIPKQHIPDKDIDLDKTTLFKSAFQGTIGGMLAAYLPAVTAGIGGIISGHATAIRGDKVFLVAGGVMKVIYYVGAFLLLFVITPLTPFGMGRGGLNIILKPVFSAQQGDYFLMISVIIFSGFISFILMQYGIKLAIKVLENVNYKLMYTVMLLFLIGLILWMTGLPGLFIMAVATCIGSIPVFYHARRSNSMGVLLIPIAINMAGYGGAVAELMHLV